MNSRLHQSFFGIGTNPSLINISAGVTDDSACLPTFRRDGAATWFASIPWVAMMVAAAASSGLSWCRRDDSRSYLWSNGRKDSWHKG